MRTHRIDTGEDIPRITLLADKTRRFAAARLSF